jgi:hypothetical protein
MQQKIVDPVRALQVGLTMQLLVSYLLVSGCALGWLLTLNIQRALRLLELTLARLMEHRTVEPLTARRSWPLVSLFSLLNGVVQEAFSNIARHARAQHVQLKLYQKKKALCLDVRDNGQGFDLSAMPSNAASSPSTKSTCNQSSSLSYVMA